MGWYGVWQEWVEFLHVDWRSDSFLIKAFVGGMGLNRDCFGLIFFVLLIDWIGKFPGLSEAAVPDLLQGVDDKSVWVSNDGKNVIFSTKQVFQDLSEQQ
ncbi:hypothetical protein QVD17_42275 [Tagetes erecta]|uniref:Uncharacterized protein n=1 Tax=Tagetes erecta TaxID=13708 RepID=A0AAD8JMG2_TARER|nr:hypothetical protein QVD17_42275 [Tagetes erecta]